MADKKGAPGELIPHAVRETLDSVVAPSVRDALLNEALAAIQQGELPTDPDGFREFVDGPLRESLLRALGNELGESVALELERVVRLVSVPLEARRRSRSGSLRAVQAKRYVTPTQRSTKAPSLAIRRTTPRPSPLSPVSRSASTLPPPAASRSPALSCDPDPKIAALWHMPAYAPTLPAARHSFPGSRPPSSADYPLGTAATLGIADTGETHSALRRLPFVLVATRDTDLIRKLAAWLDPRAAVVRVRGITGLVHDLENAADARSVIVLDCAQPSIRPLALAVFAEELPANTEIVLWGATADIKQQVISVCPAAERWIVVNAAAVPKELAARCAELVC